MAPRKKAVSEEPVAIAGVDEAPVAKKAAAKETELTVNCNPYSELNVREKPDLNAKIVRTIPHGFKVMAVPAEAGWHTVPDGYVRSEYLE